VQGRWRTGQAGVMVTWCMGEIEGGCSTLGTAGGLDETTALASGAAFHGRGSQRNTTSTGDSGLGCDW
jgi:hypothetical protein